MRPPEGEWDRQEAWGLERLAFRPVQNTSGLSHAAPPLAQKRCVRQATKKAAEAAFERIKAGAYADLVALFAAAAPVFAAPLPPVAALLPEGAGAGLAAGVTAGLAA